MTTDALSPIPGALAEQLFARRLHPHLVVVGRSGLLAMGLGDRPTLDVSFASRYDQVHLKLYALADREAPRDESDLRRLEPTTDELRAAAAWARTHNAPGPFDDQLAAALAKFGVEDVGREP